MDTGWPWSTPERRSPEHKVCSEAVQQSRLAGSVTIERGGQYVGRVQRGA
jgi:hypothetical protein